MDHELEAGAKDGQAWAAHKQALVLVSTAHGQGQVHLHTYSHLDREPQPPVPQVDGIKALPSRYVGPDPARNPAPTKTGDTSWDGQGYHVMGNLMGCCPCVAT